MASLDHLKILINLARIDGTVADREKIYIIDIGRANGIYPDEIQPLFEKQHEVILPVNLSPDQKFEYVFHLVQLMKIDERMYKEEILYCSTIASRLGYRKEVMAELMLSVKNEAMNASDVNSLRNLIAPYLEK